MNLSYLRIFCFVLERGIGEKLWRWEEYLKEALEDERNEEEREEDKDNTDT